MKRIILVYLLIMLCMCGLCGCQGTEKEPLQSQITESQKQNEETSKQEEPMEQNDAETESALTEVLMPTNTPTPTELPMPTSIPTPTATPVPVVNTIYEGTTVELSYAEIGDVVLFGSYEQDNIESNGAETIPWYVLDKDGDKVLLMSVYLLDHVKYHEGCERITWEECTLRQWMNDEFYNRAFTESEKKYILTSHLKNADNPCYGTEGGNDTEDKVFTLSLKEAMQYFGVAEDGGAYWVSALPELSAAKVTAYAEAQGVSTSSDEATAGNGSWWLRSPGYNERAAHCRRNGSAYEYGEYVDYICYAARPALWLNLNPSATTPPSTVLSTSATHTIYKGTTVELSGAEVGDVVLFGTYEQDNIESNGVETIPWYVLDKDGDKVLLMSVYLLESVPYHEEYTEITWEECTLRQWMNNDFYNRAFTESEKKYILKSHLENADNPWYGTEGGNDTEDKVFALSLAEAEQYFGIADVDNEGCYWTSASPELSAAKVTAYVKAQRALVSPNESSAGNGWWWLRSPGFDIDDECIVAYVGSDGGVDIFGCGVDYNYYVARPALWLNLNP